MNIWSFLSISSRNNLALILGESKILKASVYSLPKLNQPKRHPAIFLRRTGLLCYVKKQGSENSEALFLSLSAFVPLFVYYPFRNGFFHPVLPVNNPCYHHSKTCIPSYINYRSGSICYGTDQYHNRYGNSRESKC